MLMIDTVNQMMIDEILDRIIKTTNTAIYVSESAVDDPDKGYPYAAGYARSALKEVLESVNHLKSLVTIKEVSQDPLQNS